MNEKLRSALVAARDGDEARARLILVEFLRNEPDNVPAWVLLSKLAETDVQKAAFLRKALALDPDHAYARQALEQLGQAPAPIIAGDPGSPAGREESLPRADRATPVVQEPITPFHPELSEEEHHQDDIFEESGFDDDLFEDNLLDQAHLEEDTVEELEDQDDFTWEISDTPADLDAQASGDTIPPWVDVDGTMAETPSSADTSSTVEFTDESEDELPEWLREEGADEWLDEETEARFAQSPPDDAELEEQTTSEKAARLSAAMAMESPSVTDSDTEEGRGWLLTLLLIIAAVIFLVLVYTVLTVL